MSAASDPTSMLPLCAAILAGDESAKPAIEQHPLVSKMAEGMRPQVAFTPAEFAAAAFGGADERFSFDRLRANAQFVGPFADLVAANRGVLVKRNIARASEFVPVKLVPENVTVNMVCGGPWDAYVLIYDGPELFFDVGWFGDGPLDESLAGFETVLRHELWHRAFLEHQKANWPVDYRKTEDPATLFLYEMLNEGVAHYYSMQHKLEPDPAPDVADKEKKAFKLLAAGYPEYLAEDDDDARREKLWRSHAGVPFWEKWGAVPGALVVYHLRTVLGREGIAALIAKEPFSLFLAYAEHAGAHSAWPQLPPELIEDAKRASSSPFSCDKRALMSDICRHSNLSFCTQVRQHQNP